MNLKTNLGREFFKLVDKNFTESNSLSKIFNRKSIKISYSTMKNMQQILTQTNSKKLNQGMKKDKIKQCRCENDIQTAGAGKFISMLLCTARFLSHF